MGKLPTKVAAVDVSCLFHIAAQRQTALERIPNSIADRVVDSLRAFVNAGLELVLVFDAPSSGLWWKTASHGRRTALQALKLEQVLLTAGQPTTKQSERASIVAGENVS